MSNIPQRPVLLNEVRLSSYANKIQFTIQCVSCSLTNEDVSICDSLREVCNTFAKCAIDTNYYENRRMKFGMGQYNI